LRREAGREPVYVIRWFEGGRKRERSTGTGSRESAEDALADFLVRQEHRAQGRPRPRDPHDVLVTDLLTTYAIEHGGAAGDADRIAIAIVHLTGFFAGLSAGEITKKLCQDYGAQRVYERGPESARYTRQAAPGTIRRELEVLRAAINHGHRQRRLLYAPHVYLPPKPAHKDVWLTRADVARLLWAARDYHVKAYLPRFILLALYTGSRKTALLELKWSQVDLVHGRVDLNPLGRGQTSKRRPVVAVPRTLLGHLRRWKRTAQTEWVIERMNDGEMGPVKDVKKGLAAAGRRAGRTDVTPHVLRHTAGTWMAQAGIDMHRIGGYLGQSTAEATSIYMHHHPDFQKEAGEALTRKHGQG
jgi:integrase